MNSDKLSRRLECVASYIPKESTLADIGSDHAYLPCYCVKQGIASFAVAGEVVKGPYLSALSHVKELDLEKQIQVRQGDGLEVISQGEVDCITIAGMGGSLITSILENGKEKLPGVKRLILQPNVGSIHIRKWCQKNNWEIIAEQILEEDGKIYEVIVADYVLKHPEKLSAPELLMGPFLIREKSNVFQQKWNAEVKQWKSILQKLNEASETKELEEKKNELKTKIAYVEEVLS
ncbi:tRNA (adenine(22)-N(1))-methyltransferase [Heyndrickxia ginsengihumi]|uniref:SAM-dependent methyltransferase n=1 Tax=Heyndrickxia ginsengihumi TaxID=363870 RepID=A0A0A6V990_9BACI|nr:tRNA (adenine(22)-N(1))-methyltransferase TrmK [Heyndrickxia ginsengihumi]KHD84151.1 SAM-dependent methyltransferase [Heyndrickxia ginsengihumi]MBE6183795.1 tRNA (adenine-N(1))-methyltransferase [Bacillus sp. (in: firmicutes)]MCM3021753.1 tRNA (adenine(22)-N(1))-methyltransferase TrmK [Heyndrickxia ginsengihumi]NEY19686.1 tRNA (adenine-N(1))-methyltransferase [Heyndrickxia ginsengihumi]